MNRAITIAGFVLVGVVACIVYLSSKRYLAHIASLAQLLDEVMSTRAARVTILLFWWWLGWHFLYGKTV